jgi:drug/metabolite transporter (DMT)-like permease
MPESDAPVADAIDTPAQWFVSPTLQLWFSIFLSAVAQVFLKLGADQSAGGVLSGVAALRSGWTWLGILAIVAGLGSWLYALRSIPLIIAFNLAAFTHVLIPLACWFFLGETVSGMRWLGIALVFAGVIVIARPVAKAEELL